MPQWGRPSGATASAAAADERTRWRRAEWMQWEAQNRFQELESDFDEDERMAAERFAGDRLQYARYGRSGRRGPPRPAYEENISYEEEYDEDPELDDGEQWQIAMRQKEEELVDRAMRRISRARLRGESDVNLSREEIDALERRQLIPHPNKTGRGTPPTAAASAATGKGPAKSKRKSAGGILGFGGPAKQKQSSRKSLPAESSPRRQAQPASPEYSPQIQPMSLHPAGYSSQPTSRPGSSPSKPPSRSGMRVATVPTSRMPDPPSSFYRPTSSSRGSPTRSLPDDPNWLPRSRAGSAAPSYPAGVDPYAYQVGGGGASSSSQYMQSRRNMSGPSTVSYSSLRRAPPPQGAMARVPSGSGLSQEVIEISDSDEDDDGYNGNYDEEEEEDESDEGVTLDLVPEASASGYARGGGQLAVMSPPPPPPANARSRRSRR